VIRLVMDTNVLVSAILNDEGLEARVIVLALNRKIQLCVSEVILDEYRRVLLYSRLKFLPKEVRRLLTRLRRVSAVVAPARTLSISSDEPDNRFLECAETAHAEFLVTGDKRHFPTQWKITRVVNARELLSLIGSSFLK